MYNIGIQMKQKGLIKEQNLQRERERKNMHATRNATIDAKFI